MCVRKEGERERESFESLPEPKVDREFVFARFYRLKTAVSMLFELLFSFHLQASCLYLSLKPARVVVMLLKLRGRVKAFVCEYK